MKNFTDISLKHLISLIKSDIQEAVADKVGQDEVDSAIASITTFVVQSSEPTSTKQLWIDTSVGGVMKYHNGSAWVPIASVYS